MMGFRTRKNSNRRTARKARKPSRYRVIESGDSPGKTSASGARPALIHDFQLAGAVDDVAQEVCRHVVPMLQKTRSLTQDDQPFLHRWCEAWSELIAAEKDLRSRGEQVVESKLHYDEGGIQVEETVNMRNPALNARHEAWRQIEGIALSLGVSDEGLASISVHITQKFLGGEEADDEDEYIIEI